MDKTDAERFWSKVEKTDGCWIWHGDVGRRGYGRFKPRGRPNIAAHRFALEMAGTPVPKDMYACHHCDNPPCVRADHLFIGTPKENAWDRDRKGRRRNQNTLKTHCQHGHPLTGDNVRPAYGKPGRICMTCKRAEALPRHYRRISGQRHVEPGHLDPYLDLARKAPHGITRREAANVVGVGYPTASYQLETCVAWGLLRRVATGKRQFHYFASAQETR